MSITAIEVRGLVELARSAAMIAPEIRKEFRDALVAGGQLVAGRARAIASQEGLRASGALIGNLGVAVVGSSTVVLLRDTAKRVSPKYPAGYAYPGVYEFSAERSRPFMFPALDQEREAVTATVAFRIERLLSRTFETGGAL
jgi:hypothetical protein